MPTTDDIDPAFLARVYQFERDRLTQILPCFTGGYSLPKVWRPDRDVWNKLAAATTGCGVDPVRYVRWSLKVNQVGYPPVVPEPNRLLERRRLKLYLDELPRVRSAIELEFNIETNTASCHTTVHDKVYERGPDLAHYTVAVEGKNLGLSPLFRYTFARSYGGVDLTEFAELIEPEALFQFSEDPVENAAVYGATGHLPHGFARRAATAYARVVDAFAASRKGVRA
jgi:hypothetical protein